MLTVKIKPGPKGPGAFSGGATLMVWVLLAVCISLPCQAAGAVPVYRWQMADQDRYMYPSDQQMEKLDWREIRNRREAFRTVGLFPRQFSLNPLDVDLPGFPVDVRRMPVSAAGGPSDFQGAAVFVRDPDGVISPLGPLSPGDGDISLPRDLNLIGRYLVGAFQHLGALDIDGDGVQERICLNAKYLVSHHKNGGRVGKASVVFFDDPKILPLEIGPCD